MFQGQHAVASRCIWGATGAVIGPPSSGFLAERPIAQVQCRTLPKEDDPAPAGASLSCRRWVMAKVRRGTPHRILPGAPRLRCEGASWHQLVIRHLSTSSPALDLLSVVKYHGWELLVAGMNVLMTWQWRWPRRSGLVNGLWCRHLIDPLGHRGTRSRRSCA